MNILTLILIIALSIAAIIGIRKFFKMRIAQQKAMRAEQRKANIQGWRDLGAIK